LKTLHKGEKMSNTRNALFISHATPEDNDFAIWLASRLEMLGYEIWIDKKGLLGGEKFWQTIQKVIENDTIKVLFVYSRNIRNMNENLRDGIDKELSYAESIASQENISDFIIPLHIDNSQFNAFIGSNRLNHIPFDTSWADGLKQLLKKLEKDNVPREEAIHKSSFSEWYENEYISKCFIIPKKELFYTSWWQIDKIPQKFFMYKFHNEKQAEEILKSNKNTPISWQANILSTFDENLNYTVTKENEIFKISPESIYSFTLSNILDGFESNSFPQHREVENYFKRLLSNVISQLFLKKGLWKAKLSSQRIAFFLPLYKDLKPVKFQYPYSPTKKAPKRKSICGKFEDIGNWHYAISIQTILHPFVGFSLKSHLIFTEDGSKIISDTKKSHSYRRRKGKRFFNEEWRDLLLAFLQRLKGENGEIKIKVSTEEDYLQMKEWPENFWSEIGYNDPKSAMDLDKIENYVEKTEEEETE
jgi:hypothetical protein